MDREKLFSHLEKQYISKREMIARVPLGIQPEALWQELVSRRRSKGTVLPIIGCGGSPYWYVTTDRMVTASEKIVAALFENESEFDPYAEAPPVETLEEVFYTSYVEGSTISMQDAMAFLQSDMPPRDIEEQLIANNRMAGGFASTNLYQPIDESFIQQLAFILTDGMDDGGGDYRADDWVEIPSMGAEDYKLPPAFSIPDRVNELVSFLADPKVHPLIKAGVAQAWALVTRPFPEGNERLGRILSNVILLRSGYAYLSDISMSALIARKGYAYYTAMANIMREENAGDLTFFLEYYLELVARAVDERNLRQSKKDEILHTAEVEMAHTVLAQPIQSDSVAIVAEEVNVQSEPQNAAQEEKSEKPELPQEGGEQEQSEDHDAYVIATLGEYAGNENTIIGKLCKHILEAIKAGKKTFTVEEVARKNNLKARQFSSSIRRMKDKRIIETDSLHGGSTIYRILFGNYPKAKQPVTVPADCEDEYDPFIIEQINNLASSIASTKDRRIGTVLKARLAMGEIDLQFYTSYTGATVNNWYGDMQLALQMGLVIKVDTRHYMIAKTPSPELPVLSKSQRRIAKEMYDNFGDGTFSQEMVIATLDYAGSHVSAILHQFTLIRILDCRKEDVYRYQFLVNPEDHPECFEDVA